MSGIMMWGPGPLMSITSRRKGSTGLTEWVFLGPVQHGDIQELLVKTCQTNTTSGHHPNCVQVETCLLVSWLSGSVWWRLEAVGISDFFQSQHLPTASPFRLLRSTEHLLGLQEQHLRIHPRRWLEELRPQAIDEHLVRGSAARFGRASGSGSSWMVIWVVYPSLTWVRLNLKHADPQNPVKEATGTPKKT